MRNNETVFSKNENYRNNEAFIIKKEIDLEKAKINIANQREMHVGKKMKYMEKKFEEEKKFREKEERIKNEEEGDEEEEGEEEEEEEERMRKERILEDRMRIIEDGIRKNAKEKEVRKIRPKEEKIFMKRTRRRKKRNKY